MKKFNCIGIGLLALDIVIDDNNKTNQKPEIFAGGSCGNVISILSFLGFNSYPVARIGNDKLTNLLIEDLKKWNVNLDFIEKEEGGNTPIIIHRILKSSLKESEPKHRFEFRNPKTGNWLPRYKPVLAKKTLDISLKLPKSDVFYFDRISRSSINLAKWAKEQGALVFFEPSNDSDEKQFNECLELCDVIKFSDQRIKSYREKYPVIQTKLEIETSGKNGLSYRFKSNDWKSLNSYSIENITDTAGAGDWCSAAIIKKLVSQDIDLGKIHEGFIVDSLQYGQTLGAINCLYNGARGLMYNISFESFKKVLEMVNNKCEMDELTEFLYANEKLENENNIYNFDLIFDTDII